MMNHHQWLRTQECDNQLDVGIRGFTVAMATCSVGVIHGDCVIVKVWCADTGIGVCHPMSANKYRWVYVFNSIIAL